MEDFLVLMGEIMVIICVQSFLEIFLADRRSRYMHKILDVACYCGGLYLVLNFAFSYLFREIFGILRFYF